uniref:Uncharacterized protein n=2 Tax=Pyricularia oryzae TaxID=318829 RepID=Q2KGV1_PYRO7|nr:hypothetical protein MGCH7_ch7g234 [Pyricularia oryzae 70-15]
MATPFEMTAVDHEA